MSAYQFAGNVNWAGGVTWARGVGEAAVNPGATVWPVRGVMAVAGWPGVDHDPVKLFEQLSSDREVYQVDFSSKYLTPLQDTAATLQAFTKPAGVPGQTRTAVGASLGQSGGQVMFSIGPGAPLGTHRVAVQIGTVGGRSKSCVIQIKVDS